MMMKHPSLASESADDLQKEEQEQVPVSRPRYCLDDTPKACSEFDRYCDGIIMGAPHVVCPNGLKGELIRALAWKAVDAHNKNHGQNLKLGDVLSAYQFWDMDLVDEFCFALVVKDEEGNSKFVQTWVNCDGTPPSDLVPIYFNSPGPSKKNKKGKAKSRIVVDSNSGGSVRYVPDRSFTKKWKKGHSTATRQNVVLG